MIKLRTVAALALAGVLTACAQTQDCEVVAYYDTTLAVGATVRIVHEETDQAGLPAFSAYAQQIEDAVRAAGFVPVVNEHADLIFELNYGSGEGAEQVARVPKCSERYHYEEEQYGSPYFMGMECYEQAGELQSTYIHYLELNILEPFGPNDEYGPRVYQGLAHATGFRNNLDGMMPYLIAALFTDFPGQSGQVRRVTVARSDTGD